MWADLPLTFICVSVRSCKDKQQSALSGVDNQLVSKHLSHQNLYFNFLSKAQLNVQITFQYRNAKNSSSCETIIF